MHGLFILPVILYDESVEMCGDTTGDLPNTINIKSCESSFTQFMFMQRRDKNEKNQRNVKKIGNETQQRDVSKQNGQKKGRKLSNKQRENEKD